MSKQKHSNNALYTFCLPQVEGFDSLAELALDCAGRGITPPMSCGGNSTPRCGTPTHNPWVVLQTVSKDKLQKVLANARFPQEGRRPGPSQTQAAEAPAWFQQSHPPSPLECVAYFSMEFMLSEALPIYSGGLGNVAGDQLKAASDLGVPGGGRWTALSTGLFSSGDRQGRSAASPLSL